MIKHLWIAMLCGVILLGCGGGGSESGASTNDDEISVDDPRDQGGTDEPEDDTPTEPGEPLAFTDTQIPDTVLRSCINYLAQQNQWDSVTDVDAITCDKGEITSIEGLQQFPALRHLNITAPRFNVDELDLLASLPLADFERKPFYIDNDDSELSNAIPAIKPFFAFRDYEVVAGEKFIMMVLVTDDERRSGMFMSWFPGIHLIELSNDIGSLEVGTNVTLYWIKVAFDTKDQIYEMFLEYKNHSETIIYTEPLMSLQWVDELSPSPVYDASEEEDTVDEDFLLSPWLSLQSCGLQIDNYDPNKIYRYVFYPEGSGFNAYEPYTSSKTFFSDEHPIWIGSVNNPNCMELIGNGAGIYRVYVGNEDQYSVSTVAPVIDENGLLTLWMFNNGSYGGSVPGEIHEDLYHLKSNDHLSKVDAATGQTHWEVSISGYPLFSSDAGVYLTESSAYYDVIRGGQANPLIQTVTNDASVINLPPLPVDILPTSAIATGDEIWFAQSLDSWGGTPNLVVWNESQHQWRSVLLRAPTGYYQAIKMNGQFCVHYNFDDSSECWNPSSQQWEPVDGLIGSKYSTNIDNTLINTKFHRVYTPIFPSSGMADRLWIFDLFEFGFLYSEWNDEFDLFSDSNALLVTFDSDLKDWVAYGPDSFYGAPNRVSAKKDGDLLHAVFDDRLMTIDLLEYPLYPVIE